MRSSNEYEFMRQCLQIAQKGIGTVNPNPLVGCIIVRKGKIVGKGFHQKYGGSHAEIFALLRAGKKAKRATMYINLEPCVHFGKTPPCVDAIIQSGISKVIIAMKDPNPLVNGRSLRRLREAGIQVQVGIMQTEAKQINEKFVKFMKTGMPFVGIKIAQTLDGYIADALGKSKWITSKEARKEAHRLRSEYDAVLIGATTVINDDPELTVRIVKGRNPVRVVIDNRLSISLNRKIFDTTNAPTWVFTSKSALILKKSKVRALALKGVRVFEVSPTLRFDGRKILQILSSEGISSVLIEGGSETIAGFISQGLSDKLYLFVAPRLLGGGLNAFQFSKPRLLNTSLILDSVRQSFLGKDILIEANFIHI